MPAFLWTQKQDFGPRPRTGHSLSFDSRRNKTVLFGGDSLNSRLYNDTWEWDGEFWTQVGDMGPAPRRDHAMAFDANLGRTVIFGGAADAARLSDTWNWDGNAWTQLSNSGPAPRSGHTLVFSPSRNTVILFGGESVNGATLGDTWEFNGNDWTQLDETGPAARKFHAMTYDGLRNRIVLFGGMSVDTVFNDTWEWNGTNWIQVADFGPDNCLGTAMAFTNSRASLFGGISSLNVNPGPLLYNKSWDWDGRHWTQRQDIGPGHRWGHAMCFDSRRASLVLFGGMSVFPAAQENTLGDTWEHLDTAAPGAPPEPDNPPQELRIQALEINPTEIRTDEILTMPVTVGVLLSEPVSDAGLTIPLFFVSQQLANNPPLPPGFQPTALPPIIVDVGSSVGQVEIAPGTITETSVIVAQQLNDPAETVSAVITII